jgi:uncharacterized membrane protein YcaP (DUF421 family)
MTELERAITVASLVNAAIFYGITVIVFLVARKTRLNKALALQKFDWLLIITVVALPAYVSGYPLVPGTVRMVLWSLLSFTTWWVLYEVYRANWYEGWRALVVTIARETGRLPIRCGQYGARLYGKWRHKAA